MARLKSLLDFFSLYSLEAHALASCILVLFSAYHICNCIHKRLWLFPCYPTPFTSLNAATLALLSIAIKFPKIFNHSTEEADEEWLSFFSNVMGSLLACAVIGACLPSIASTDRRQLWTNLAGTILLVMTVSFGIFLGSIQYMDFSKEFPMNGIIRFELQVAGIVLFVLVLVVQAFSMDEMISDVAACVSMRLKRLKTGRRTISGADEKHVNIVVWSWEALDGTTCIKLMMALTSNLQNVASRSPSSAILLALILIPPVLVMSGVLLPYAIIPDVLNALSMLLFGFMCWGRWLRLAMSDDRPLLSLLFHWHQVSNFSLYFKARPARSLHPTIWMQISFALKSTVYSTLEFIMLFFIGPLQWLLLTPL